MAVLGSDELAVALREQRDSINHPPTVGAQQAASTN